MNAVRVSTLASVLLALGLCAGRQGPAAAGEKAVAAGGRVLTGELVVTDAARDQFRLVRHRGSFTAPPGISVQTLDGKAVGVEIGRDGRVVRIGRMPIPLAPITHAVEVISGAVTVRDAARCRFSLAGDDRTYVAPFGVAVERLAGRMVELRVDEAGRVMGMTPIARVGDAPLYGAPRACGFGEASVPNGQALCRRGTTLRCADGEWVDTGRACREP